MPTLDLEAICKPPPTESYKFVPQPIYRFDDYIALYERHCKEVGYPFDPTRFDPKLYKYVAAPEQTGEPVKAPLSSHVSDRIRVHLDVEEQTERITIVLNTTLHDLYEKYWSKNDQPPLNELVVAFKKLGADDAFLKKIIKRHDKIRSVCKKFDLDKAFKPKSKSKNLKKKKEDVPPPPDELEEDREEEEEEEEFEGMDVEENDEDEDDQGEEFMEDMDED
jgi:DNA-directed RNA polymerase delta subunit